MADETPVETTVVPDPAPATKVVDEGENLKKQIRSLQRELERARRGAQDASGITDRLDSLIELQMALATGDDDTGDVRSRIEKLRAQRAMGQGFARTAGEQAEVIKEALGDLELDWNEAPELEKARSLWSDGIEKESAELLRKAAVESVRVAKKLVKPAPPVSNPPVEPSPPTPSKPAPRTETGESTVTKTPTMTAEQFKALSPAERLRRIGEAKEAFSR